MNRAAHPHLAWLVEHLVIVYTTVAVTALLVFAVVQVTS